MRTSSSFHASFHNDEIALAVESSNGVPMGNRVLSRQSSVTELGFVKKEEEDTKLRANNAEEDHQHLLLEKTAAQRVLLLTPAESSVLVQIVCPTGGEAEGRRRFVFRDDELAGRLLGRSRLAKSYLMATSVLPCFIMVITLIIEKSIWAAMLTFHIVPCVLLPCVYIVCAYPGLEGLLRVWESFMLHVRVQVTLGVIFFLFGLGLGLLGYKTFAKALLEANTDAVLRLGLGADVPSMALFALYFCIVNPVVEEFFWRGFMMMATGHTEQGIWGVCVMYASYHVVVLAALEIEFWIIGVVWIGLILAGRLFSLLNQYTGMFSAILAHMSADVVIVCVLFDWFYSWLARRRLSIG